MSENRYKKIDDMNWPDPAKLHDLAWRLTHAPDSITHSDKLVASSVIAAYQQMIKDGRAQREYVCKALRQRP